jgi:tripartite-type tricarboxylate transporter receptor subunit TctC
MKNREPANMGINRSAQRRRRWVPVALRAPAPGYARRSASQDTSTVNWHRNSDSLRSCPYLLGFLIAALLCTPLGSLAQEFPTRPITLIVPFPAGGSSDVQARLIAKELSGRLGKQVIIDNRGGAGGTIGAELAARAVPDGHTLLFGGFSVLVVEPTLRKNLPYDIARDFSPISVATVSPRVLVVGPQAPGSNLTELIAAARRSPGTLTYASVGPGSTAHLYLEAFKASAGIDLIHVTYKGEAPALVDIAGGQVTMMLTSVTSALPHIRGKKLRALAVTGTSRAKSLPEVPTFREFGITNMDAEAWWGLLAPRKTSPDIVRRLNTELAAALNSPQLVAALGQQGVAASPSTPEKMTAMMNEDRAFISQLVHSIKFNVDD